MDSIAIASMTTHQILSALQVRSKALLFYTGKKHKSTQHLTIKEGLKGVTKQPLALHPFKRSLVTVAFL